MLVRRLVYCALEVADLLIAERFYTDLLAMTVRLFFLILRLPPTSTLFPYTTLFRSLEEVIQLEIGRFTGPHHNQPAGLDTFGGQKIERGATFPLELVDRCGALDHAG